MHHGLRTTIEELLLEVMEEIPSLEGVRKCIVNPDVITKYKTAGDISSRVLDQVKKQVVAGAKVFDLCKAGDALMEEELAKIYTSKKAAKKAPRKAAKKKAVRKVARAKRRPIARKKK